MFKEIIETKRKNAYAVEQILAAIERGEYKQGDKLPPERMIAEQMNVSRNCVREALSVLQIAHILESKVGAGTYVRNPAGAKVDIGQVIGLVKDTKDLWEIWEARKEIEIVLVKLAIDRATSEDLTHIACHLGEMRDAFRAKDTQKYLAANERFHLSIANSADNLPLQSALQALHGFTNKELLNDVNIGYVIEGMEKSLREHEDILSAIRDRDKQAGTKAMQVHFRELESYFENKYLAEVEESLNRS